MKLRRRGGEGGLLPSLPDEEALRPWLLVAGMGAAAFVAGWLLAAQVLFPPASEAEDVPLVEVPGLEGADLEDARSQLEDRGLGVEVAFRPASPGADSGTVVGQRPLSGQMAPQGSSVRLAVSRGGGAVRVPGLRGLPEERARSILRILGLDVTSRREPSAVRAGEVVGTEPPAGEVVAVPGSVELVVSEGPEVSRVPEVVGRHVDDVPAILQRADLELGAVEFDPDAAAAPGRVVGQSPPPDFALRRGGSVSIRVAGPRGDWTPAPPGSTPDTTEDAGGATRPPAGGGEMP